MAFGNYTRPWLMQPAEFLALRKSTGLSQIAAAKATGIGATAIKSYEKGKTPAPKAVITVLQVLAARREALITGKRRDIMSYIDDHLDVSL